MDRLPIVVPPSTRNAPDKQTLQQLRERIAAACRPAETACVHDLLSMAHPAGASDPDILSMATSLIENARRQPTASSPVGALMRRYPLSSDEGVTLMCLAESLLRVPDPATADALIADKIGKGNWRGHGGHDSSALLNAAGWALHWTGKLVGQHRAATHNPTRALQRVASRICRWPIRQATHVAMRLLGNQFICGRTIEEAIANNVAGQNRGYRHSYDMLGEAAITEEDAAFYQAAYETALHAIGRVAAVDHDDDARAFTGPGISVKLSALHPRYAFSQRGHVMRELFPRLERLVALAKHYRVGLTIDAEEADRLDLSLDLAERLVSSGMLAGYRGFGMALQAYQKRCPFVIDFLTGLARYHGCMLTLRLVKGAYWDTEIKHSQVEGLADYPVYTRKAHTDLSYLVCAQKLLDATDVVYPQFATHNAHSIAAIHTWARQRGIVAYEFQCLHGMGGSLYDQLVGGASPSVACRIYAPVGSHRTLLPYLVRRLLENGANASFVNQIGNADVPVESLLSDPFELATMHGGAPNPTIPLPLALYGATRANSSGLDLSDTAIASEIEASIASIAKLASKAWHAEPLCIHVAAQGCRPEPRMLRNPADRCDVVGTVVDASSADCDAALHAAHAFAAEWEGYGVTRRAELLVRAADTLEAHRIELIALAVREAGKAIPAALAEVREAVDFLRYYAMQSALASDGPALGTVVCISPWNFPLAIFVGQIGAALATGNVVIAKPAEQTPLMAYRAVALLHAAGIPPHALQLLPGAGETVGATLVADGRVSGVVFTGSTGVAHQINRSLQQRASSTSFSVPKETEEEAVLIAETGGQNAMIVDATALPEQVVQDVLTSAFDSAGQRCSALRVLCLQSDIADIVLEKLRGAMLQLRVGDPSRMETDIGPVIDDEARQSVSTYIEDFRRRSRVLIDCPLPAHLERGCFVAPTVLAIDSLEELRGEVFGPVVHVLRYDSAHLPQLIDAINHLGYGLTMGLHSRIDARADMLVRRARVGNLYVNRNMVGAVVGVQPFGGEGKSGTGPKAGGPLYLLRLRRNVGIESTTALLQNAATSTATEERGEALRAATELVSWCRAQGMLPVATLCEHYARVTLLGLTLPLPGPTGERNSLHFEARGKLPCRARSLPVLLHQLAATLATGNQAVLDRECQRLLPANLPRSVLSKILFPEDDELCSCPERHDLQHCQLFLIDAAEAGAPTRGSIWESTRTGGQDDQGPVMQILRVGQEPIALWRLVAERAVCVNTAAAGGNASLMASTD